jgi:PAS domain S-box-containing protein
MNMHADGIAFEKPQKKVFQKPEKETLKEEIIIDPVIGISEFNKEKVYIGHPHAVIESFENAIISKFLDGIVNNWNKRVEKMFGYTLPETIGNIFLIIPPEYLNEENRFWRKQTTRFSKTKERKPCGRISCVQMENMPFQTK